MTSTTLRMDTPQVPTKINIVHWSSGDSYRVKGPPEQDALLEVGAIQVCLRSDSFQFEYSCSLSSLVKQFFFNSSNPTLQAGFLARCLGATSQRKTCDSAYVKTKPYISSVNDAGAVARGWVGHIGDPVSRDTLKLVVVREDGSVGLVTESSGIGRFDRFSVRETQAKPLFFESSRIAGYHHSLRFDNVFPCRRSSLARGGSLHALAASLAAKRIRRARTPHQRGAPFRVPLLGRRQAGVTVYRGPIESGAGQTGDFDLGLGAEWIGTEEPDKGKQRRWVEPKEIAEVQRGGKEERRDGDALILRVLDDVLERSE